ncbi:YD repeat protein [Methanolacinia petrolearia DSM 11571]|uniref:YD repeat protein n=2 Tax=Methanolacinia TaxID=230355 RepID=E1RGQ1_METP4|nr:YD repeat protein [Methanolacinia petrolearia DSM 11571]
MKKLLIIILILGCLVGISSAFSYTSDLGYHVWDDPNWGLIEEDEVITFDEVLGNAYWCNADQLPFDLSVFDGGSFTCTANGVTCTGNIEGGSSGLNLILDDPSLYFVVPRHSVRYSNFDVYPPELIDPDGVSGFVCGYPVYPGLQTIPVTFVSPSRLSMLEVLNNRPREFLRNLSALGIQGFSALSSEPVNLATGNYVYQYQDLYIPGRGLPLAVTRSYNSQSPMSGPFGSGWTFNYNMRLAGIKGSEDVLVIREDGHTDIYNAVSNGTYSPPLGVFDRLTINADCSYTLESKDHIKYIFTPTGQLSNITDNNGNKIDLTYTGDYLTRVTDSSGRELTFTYDAAGRIVSITDPIGRILSYTYDANDNLIRYTDPAGGQFDYTYDENHWLTSITNSRGIQFVTNTYDGDGRVISQSNAQGVVTTFSYDMNNRTTTETDPLGRSTQYTHNEYFWELNEVDALGNTTYYTYDSNGNRITATDANRHSTLCSYDENGNIIQVTDASGHVTNNTYDSKSNLLSSKDALGHQETFSYDVNSNLVQTTNAMGYVTTFTYDQYGQVTNTQDANGHATTNSYDNYGNLIALTDAAGNTETYSYDLVGRQVSATDAKGKTSTLIYDALDRLLSITDPLGHSTAYSYDGVGNRISCTDAMGRTTFYTYDSLNLLTQVTDPLGGTASYAYDTVENLVSMTDANGHTTQYSYDQVNRLTAITDPLGYITGYSYDAVGNKVSSTDNNGDTTHLTYDSLDRITGISYHDQTSASYTYDAVGNRLTMTDSSGTTSYAYDGLNRLTGVTGSGGQFVQYGYDPVGNRIQTTYPDGRTVSYGYDNVNRLNGVTDWTGSITSYGYDANSNLVDMTYPNGRETEYTYDDANRLTNMINTDGEDVVSSHAYTLDAVGNHLQVTESGLNVAFGLNVATTTYEYDVLNRLDTVTSPGTTVTYTYDSSGNRLSMATTAGNVRSTVAYTYDAGDRLLSAGGTTYTYDNNGNRIQKNELNGTTLYGYDDAGRLAGVSLPGGTSVEFAYDGDGNRLSKSVDSANTTWYVWDVNGGLPQVLTETDGEGTSLSLYGLQRISMTNSSGEQIYYQYDGLGSVRGLSDGSGNTVAGYSYDAFGEPDFITGQEYNDFLFTGEQTDSETGLIYLRARYYDPETGRFISKDPFTGFATNTQSLNRYTYVQNNPVRFTDPSGKVLWWVPGVAGAAINDAWYIGEVIGTYAATGENTFSLCTLAGRTAGGFAGGTMAAYAAGSLNPVAAGAAWSAAEYSVDTYTQGMLSSIGVPGSTEEFSWEGLAVSTGSGAISGGFGKKIFSPNVGRNPKYLITALTGKQMQKEMRKSRFGNIVNAGLANGVK